MSNVNIIFPAEADTLLKQFTWMQEELARLYIDRENLWSKERAAADYDTIKSDRDTAKSRIAELLRIQDEIKSYCIKEKQYNPNLKNIFNVILDILK